jgi:hypothetical protein
VLVLDLFGTAITNPTIQTAYSGNPL